MPKYDKWMKSKKWLDFVRSLDCFNCKAKGPSEAHHVGSRGMGLKVPDSCCIPLCRLCHAEHHDLNRPSIDWCRTSLAKLWAALAEEADTDGIAAKINHAGSSIWPG